MKTLKKTFAFLMVLFLVMGSLGTAFGQEKEDTRPYVYSMEFQIPWSRVDSLTKLVDLTDKEYKFYDKAKEMGYILDFRIMIHDTGNEWNVRIEWVYPSWEAIREPGWGKKVWEALEIDSAKVEEINAGFTWVTKDVIHRDNIYRLNIGAF